MTLRTLSLSRHVTHVSAVALTAALLVGSASPLLALDERVTVPAAAADVPAITADTLLVEGIVATAAPITGSIPIADVQDSQDAQPLHAGAFEYSDAYQTRRKIHKIASFATLPLFATELALGQSMYNATPSDASSKRGLHAAVGAGIVGLFAVNTVTGAWNLFGEGRHDPNGRTLKLVHGLLMMVADAGFVATEMTGPNSRSARQALTYESNKMTHRNIAVASISVASVSYLLMVFGNK